jgi:hypothetical protein
MPWQLTLRVPPSQRAAGLVRWREPVLMVMMKKIEKKKKKRKAGVSLVVS